MMKKITAIRALVTGLVVCLVLTLFARTVFLTQLTPVGTDGDWNTIPKDTTPRDETAVSRKPQVIENYGKLPLIFEANQGQTDARVKFISRGPGYNLYLTPTEAVLTLRKAEAEAPESPTVKRDLVPALDLRSRLSKQPALAEVVTVRMKLVGGRLKTKVAGAEQQSAKVNYFHGKDQKKWQTAVPTYGRVLYKNVYRGVDLIYHGKQGQLEYDFTVKPGADPNQIRLRFSGAEKIRIDESGDLVMSTKVGEVRQHKPVVYQEVSGRRKEIAGTYSIKANREVGFEIGSYDVSQPLVIDPVLVYSTYLGGNGTDMGYGIAVDSARNAYVTGWTTSSDFPTLNAFQSSYRASNEVFVTKLTASGELSYSTYLGGNDWDSGQGIAVDSAGNAYVTGTTLSSNFPTLNAYQADFIGLADAFVTKLTPSGGISYSTFLGGIYGEVGAAIAVDQAGNAYVTGATTRLLSGFGNQDVFVTKLTASGGLSYSTNLQSDDYEVGNGITVDSTGNAYVTGLTTSTSFPILNAFQSSYQGGVDAFVTKLTACGGLSYSTYLGGSDWDNGQGIAVDSAGNAYVTGTTLSTNFPTLNAFETSYQGGEDAFVTKLNMSNPPPVVISEFRTRGPAGANDEFVELYNNTDCAMDVSGWKIRRSNDAASISTLAIIANGTIIPAGGHFLATNNEGDGYSGSIPGDQTYGSDITDNGGIALTRSDDSVIDQAGLSSGSAFREGTVLQPLTTNDNNGYERKPGGLNGSTHDANNNASDFQEITPSDPQNLNSNPTPRLTPTVTSSLAYSTYLGGEGLDNGYSIAVDSTGNAYVTGWTSSHNNFPILSALQAQHGGAPSYDAFVSKMTATGALGYSTYLGGSEFDISQGIAVDAHGSAYVTGVTLSPNFPTANPLQPFLSGQYDSFVAKIFDSSLFSVGAILPNRGGNTGDLTVSVLGAGFQAGATVKLKAAGQPDIGGANPIVVNSSSIAATFDLRGATPGHRDVVVTLPDGSVATFPNGFTVEQDGASQVWVDVVGRDTIRLGREQTYNIVYGNRGNIDLEDEHFIVLSCPANGNLVVDRAIAAYGDPAYPPVVDGSEQAVAIFVPPLPAQSSRSFTLRFTTPTNAPVTIRAAIISIRSFEATPGFANQTTAQTMLADVITEASDETPPVGATVYLGPHGVNPFGHQAFVGEDPITKTVVIWDHFVGKESLTLDEWKRAWRGAPYLGWATPPGWTPEIGKEAAGFAADIVSGGAIPDARFGKNVFGNNRYSCAGFCELAYEKAGLNPNLFGLDLLLLPGINYRRDTGKIDFYTSFTDLNADLRIAAVWLKQISDSVGGWLHVLSRAQSSTEKFLQVVAAMDPNEKTGSLGVGVQRYLSGEEPLRYAIFFENVASATAPAQEVVVSDQLDTSDLDLSTFAFGPITFGNRQLMPPPRSREFTANVDLRPQNDLIVNIDARLNKDTGLVTWKFISIGPATGQPTDDPLAGFLPPNVNPPEGDGNVFFTVMPKQGLLIGTEIRNQASIVFDANAAIQTPTWVNTIDNSAPVSGVHALNAPPCSANLNVQWSGTDTGSGIRGYTIYVSVDGGPFTVWQNNTTATSGVYAGQFGHTYSFYSVAQDQTGNIENIPAGPDTGVALDAPGPPTLTSVPPPITVSTGAAATGCGRFVSDAVLGTATAAGACPNVNVTRTGIPGGNIFPVGNTTITYTVTDAFGNTASATQTVTVIDNTPPVISCPANVTVTAKLGITSALASYSTPAATDNCGFPIVSCSIASGSYFAVGTTTVSCTATDRANNAGSCAFTVKVLTPQDATQQLVNKVNSLISQGVLNQGNGNALVAKLQAAINSMNRGDANAACNQLEAFINQTQAFIKSGKLTLTQGQSLITSANAVKAVLGC